MGRSNIMFCDDMGNTIIPYPRILVPERKAEDGAANLYPVSTTSNHINWNAKNHILTAFVICFLLTTDVVPQMFLLF